MRYALCFWLAIKTVTLVILLAYVTARADHPKNSYFCTASSTGSCIRNPNDIFETSLPRTSYPAFVCRFDPPWFSRECVYTTEPAYVNTTEWKKWMREVEHPGPIRFTRKVALLEYVGFDESALFIIDTWGVFHYRPDQWGTNNE